MYPKTLIGAVFLPGSELARSALRSLRSDVAVRYAFKSYLATSCSVDKITLCEIISYGTDPEFLGYARTLTTETDPSIVLYGIKLIESIAFNSNADREIILSMLQSLRRHASSPVRKAARELISEVE